MNSIDIRERIFSIENQEDFNALSMEVFRDQYKNISVYKEYCDLIGRNPENVESVLSIPFLPISAFKHHIIQPGHSSPDIVFKSSGTGNALQRSSHFIIDLSLYHESLKRGFETFFDKVENYVIASLLPGYSDNPESSLIHMVEELARYGSDSMLHRFHDNPEGLIEFLHEKKACGSSVLLFGVTFALLDLAENHSLDLSNMTIIETGGMK